MFYFTLILMFYSNITNFAAHNKNYLYITNNLT